MEDIAQLFRAALRLIRQRPECASLIPVAELGLRLSEADVDFGELIRQRREAAELSTLRLAKLAGLSDNTIKNIEAAKGTPTMETVARLLAVKELKMGSGEYWQPLSQEARDLRPNSYMTLRYDPARWSNDLRTAVNGPGCTLEQSFLYLDNQSAADYLKVCEAYSGLRTTQFGELQRLASLILEQAPGPLQMVAIGPGDARPEVHLAKPLAEAGRLQKLYLLDISNTLLAAAQEHADAVLYHYPVEVETIHGNFHYLANYPMIHAANSLRSTRLYTLLGATLANLVDERRFFADLHSCARIGDLLAVDFQLSAAPPDQVERVRAEDPALRAGVPSPQVVTWQTGPLRRHIDRPIQDLRMVTELAEGRISGSYEVHCVAHVTLDNGENRRYVLMRSTRYDMLKLSESLLKAGWETKISWSYEKQMAGLLLLQRI